MQEMQETWVPSLGWKDRSLEEGNSYPCQYSCLENPMDRGAWQTTVHGGGKELDETEQLSTHIRNIEAISHGLTVSTSFWPITCSKFSKPGFSSTWTNFQDVQGGFRKGRGTRDQIANICWTIEKAREFQKNIYFSFIDYAKALSQQFVENS